MNLKPCNQLKLYGLHEDLKELIKLYNNKKLPNKILFSGQKGIGKCTLAYHLINYILSEAEDFPYILKDFSINDKNKTFKLINNGSLENFTLIDIQKEKKNIEIEQIRNLINIMNKSIFNNKPRFVLIDNTEFLNKNSINALLKILEEPNNNVFFILIHNNTRILSTLKSRCLNFKLNLTHIKSLNVLKNILTDINEINHELISYYFSPGNIYNLIHFLNENNIDPKENSLKQILLQIIEDKIYKKESNSKKLIFDLVELFLRNNYLIFNLVDYSDYLKLLNDIKKFNLDEESFFIEFRSKFLRI